MGESMTSSFTFEHHWERGPGPNRYTVLLLHGTGGTEFDLIDLGRSLLPEANLLSPRGQVSENGAARFFKRIAEGVFDLDDLHRRTLDLAGFVADAASVYEFDTKRVLAVGYSNGANIAASLLLSGADTLAGAVLFHPMVPFEPATLPDLKGKSVFVGAGRQDPLVPEPLTTRLIDLLTASGAAVETHWENGGHRLNRAEIEAAKLWLKQKCTGSKA
jgi:phospholipase/carboxylesterase